MLPAIRGWHAVGAPARAGLQGSGRWEGVTAAVTSEEHGVYPEAHGPSNCYMFEVQKPWL